MNQSGWIILLTLIVWSKCDPVSESDGMANLGLIESDHWEPNEDLSHDQSNDERQFDFEDIDPSASSQVESVKNQSELNANLVNLMKNHNLFPQLEQLKRNPNLLNHPSGQQHLMSDLLKNLVNNSSDSSAEKLNEHANKDFTGKSYDINELKKYYNQIKMEESDGTKDSVTQPSQPIQDQHTNHNYFATGEWRPLISTSDHRLAPLGQPRDSYYVPSSRVTSYMTNEMPTSLANFYVDSDHRLLHAHESQNKDLKEVKDTSSNIAIVKDLISTKDPSNTKVDKLSSVSHKQGSYVPVENDKYQEYMSCCEQLFKNYANKDYYHEDIYLVPKGEDKYSLGQPMMVNHHPGMKPVSYLRGYPIIEPDVKFIGPGKEMPPGKHIPVQCLEDHQHSGHMIPAYASHHPPPMFHPPPPAALLLKKKLALIGKKYFFGK